MTRCSAVLFLEGSHSLLRGPSSCRTPLFKPRAHPQIADDELNVRRDLLGGDGGELIKRCGLAFYELAFSSLEILRCGVGSGLELAEDPLAGLLELRDERAVAVDVGRGL